MDEVISVACSRRDDIIAMIYMLIFLINKSLPWMKVNSKGFKEKFKKIQKLKQTLDLTMIADDKASK